MIVWSIYKLRDGGYFAQEGASGIDQGMFRPPLFASAHIGEVLEYIRRKIEEPQPK